MMDDSYIPRATAEKLATDFPLGTRHQAKIDIAVPLIANGMAPAAVALQLRSKFPNASEREIDNVIDWVVSKNPTPSGRGNGNGSYRSNGYGTLPSAPKPPSRTPDEQMRWWLNGLTVTQDQFTASSTIQIPEEPSEAAALAIASLYSESERLNVVTEYTLNDKGKANPKGAGETKSKQEWIDDFILYGVPCSDAGAWFRMNPVRQEPTGENGGWVDADITAPRYMLVEFDKTPIECQMAFFSKVKLPIAAALMSGGKSVHAWVKLDAPDTDRYRELTREITEALKPFGADGANKNPSRLSRLPGAERKIQAFGDGIQRLLYLNPLVTALTDEGLRVFKESLMLPLVEDNPLKAMALAAPARYQELLKNKGKTGVPLGIRDLDDISGGMKAGQTIVVAGATGGCKTTLALHAVVSALREKYGVLLFSLEMDKEEVFDLLVSNYASVDRNKFNNGNFYADDFIAIDAAIAGMQNLPLYIEDSAMNNTDQMRLRVMQLAAEKKIGLVIVDYIQFVNPGIIKDTSREQQVAAISHNLRVIARESRLPMLVLSQLNDEGKLRESRVIAHNANTVLLVEVEKTPTRYDRLKISVVKGRGIPTGDYYMDFNRQYARLFSLKEQEDMERMQQQEELVK